MTAPEVFRAIIKALGVWEFLQGLEQAPLVVMSALARTPSGTGRAGAAGSSLLSMAFGLTFYLCVLKILVGLALFFGATALVKLAYPKRAEI